MDLASGRVVVLRSTIPTECGSRVVPRWDPDRLFPGRREGRRGPNPAGAIWLIDADGQRRQLSPTTLAPRTPNGRRTAPASSSSRHPPPGQLYVGHLYDPARRDRRASPDHRRGLGLGDLDAGRADPVRSARRRRGGLVDDERRWHRCRASSSAAAESVGGRRLLVDAIRRGSRSVARRSCHRHGHLHRRPRSDRRRRHPPRPPPRTWRPASLDRPTGLRRGRPLSETATPLADGHVLVRGAAARRPSSTTRRPARSRRPAP